jgi:hypothetical protein
MFRRLALAALLTAVISNAVAGSVSGTAVDDTGAPVAGIHVEVVYQSLRADQLNSAGESIKETDITGADGSYRIATDHLPPGEYAANAFEIVVNGGSETNIDLVPDDASTFAGNADTVRNFTAGIVESSPELPYGNGGVFVLNNAIGDFTDLSPAEVTLTNVETGKTYVKTVRPTGEGLAVTGIPFGTYEVSVRLAGQPLQIQLWGPGIPDEFGPSVVHDFTMGYAGNQMQVAAKP